MKNSIKFLFSLLMLFTITNLWCAINTNQVYAACAHTVSDWSEVTASKHSGMCSKCGSIVSKSHETTNVSCTTASMCKECDYIVKKALGHNYAVATCTKPETCTRCNKTRGNALGHKVGDWSEVTAANHSGYCTICGTTMSEKHSLSNATCKSASICSVCDYVAKKALGHNYTAATCTKPATCTRCSSTTGSALGHKIGDWSEVTAANHSGYCTICGTIMSKKHTFNNATCTKASICNECDYVEKGALGHDYTGAEEYEQATTDYHVKVVKCSRCTSTKEENESHNLSKATCIDNIQCKKCGYMVKDSALGHQLGEWTDVTSGEHRGYCLRCNKTLKESHKFDEKGKCTECDFVSTIITVTPSPNVDTTTKEYKVRCTNDKINRLHTITYNYTKYTVSGHNFIYKCKECNFTSTEIRNKKHTYNENGKCVCGRQSCTVENLIDGHKLKTTYKKSTDNAVKDEQHIISTKCTECNVSYEVLEMHTFNEKGVCTICKYKNAIKAKCTEEKAVNGHNIKAVGYEKIVNKTGKEDSKQHIISQYCNDCKIEIIAQKQKHTFDEKGNCPCGYYDADKAMCTETTFVKGHKITIKYSYKDITDETIKDECHMVMQTCKKCKIFHGILEKHSFNENGICTAKGCGYKNPLKSKCTGKNFVKEHYDAGYVTVIKYEKINNIYNHNVTYSCSLCNVENIKTGKMESHNFNDDGICKCGYVNSKKMKCNEQRFVETHTIGTFYEGTATGHVMIQRCKACKVKIRSEEKVHDFSTSITPEVKSISFLLHGTAATKCSTCGVLNYENKEAHKFGEEGICTVNGCGYKKLTCTSNNFIAEHYRELKKARELVETDKDYRNREKYHILEYYCAECNATLNILAQHTINADGSCMVCTYHTDSTSRRRCTEEKALESHMKKLVIKYSVTDENTHTKSGFCAVNTCQKYVILEKNVPHNFIDGVCKECGFKKDKIGLNLLAARLGTVPGYTMNSDKYNDGIDGFDVANYNSAIGKDELRPGGDGWDCNDPTIGLPIDEYSLVANPETRTGYTYYDDIEFISSNNNTNGLSAQELLDATLIETSPDCYAYRLIDSNWKDVAVQMGTYTFDGYKENGHSFSIYYIPEDVCGVEGGCYAMQSGGYAGVDDYWTVKG